MRTVTTSVTGVSGRDRSPPHAASLYAGPVRLAYEVISQGEPTFRVIPGLVSHITWSEPH